jgi:UDP-glucuronate 4-epimerase
MAPFKFIDRIFNGLPIQQYGDGSTSRDYTFVDDIVDGIVRSIDRPLGCEVINLGNGRPYLLRDFIRLVETNVGSKAQIEVLPEQPGDVDRTCANISKAQRLLGYAPKVTFEEGIRKTVEWYKEASRQGLFDESDNKEVSSSSSSSSSPPVPAPQPFLVVLGDTNALASMRKRPKLDAGGLRRNESDLELSSYVDKASDQLCDRRKRIFTK